MAGDSASLPQASLPGSAPAVFGVNPGLASTEVKSAAAPASTPESKNVFTELFGDRAPTAAADVMNHVVTQQDKKTLSFFGDKPQGNALYTSLKNLTSAAPSAHASHPGQAFLKASFALLLLTVLGFSSQTRAEFSFFYENPAERSEALAAQLDTLSAEVQVQHALTATLLLDAFSTQVDEYLYAQNQALSEYVSQNKRAEFSAQVESLRPQLIQKLSQVRSELKDELTPDSTQAAVQALETLNAQVRAKEASLNSTSLQQELHDLETARKLITNLGFRSFISDLNAETITDAQLKDVFERFGALSSNLSSTIRSVQSERRIWSALFEETERLTKTVDPLFGTEFSGSLVLKNLKFSSEGTLSISGETLTQDTKNFTVVSNFIDTLEDSSLFENVVNRSYQKSSREAGYAGQFNLQMKLENMSSDLSKKSL